MSRKLDIVFLGLSLSSSWGNGHATTFRGLLRGLARLGHDVTFLERDVPWYASHRDLRDPEFCDLCYYDAVSDLPKRHARILREADAVIVGSFVPEGVAVIDTVAGLSSGRFCFYDIDTPVTLEKLEANDREYLCQRQIPLFDIYFSFTGGPTLARLEDVYGARRAEPLYCSADPERHRNTGERPRWDLGYLGTYSPDRQPTLERLLFEPARRMPERRFVIAGSQFPDDMEWPQNVERIEHLPPAEHAAFYSRQRYTLNVTRASMVEAGWSPSVRLFEAAACGTPIISDVWPGLESFFPIGKEIHTAASAEEIMPILAGEAEETRLGMADLARKRVLARHTGLARAKELVEALTVPRPARQANVKLDVNAA